jgi:hypothetical protein
MEWKGIDLEFDEFEYFTMEISWIIYGFKWQSFYIILLLYRRLRSLNKQRANKWLRNS